LANEAGNVAPGVVWVIHGGRGGVIRWLYAALTPTYIILFKENDMIAEARVFSPTEAAVVSDVGIKVVHNAIDKHIVAVSRPVAGAGRRAPRTLTADDVLRVKLWYWIGPTLSSERRLRLFEEIAARPAAKKIKADDLLIVDVGEARRQVATRVRDLDEADAAIHRVRGLVGGEAVFKGTRIPVRVVVGMLSDGATEAEILEGYPKLNARMLELARLWVLAHPRRGRPKSLASHRLKSSKRIPLGG
jgi:uncharacterized protein (DUF433 family)